MNIKLIATILILLQLTASLSYGFTGAGLDSGETVSSVSMGLIKAIKSTSVVMAVVNNNFTEQIKLVSCLTAVSIGLTNKAIPPSPTKKTIPVPSDTCSIPSTNTYGNNKDLGISFALYRNIVSSIPPFVLLFAVIGCLFIIQIRFRKYFFLLPGGSIDDAISAIPTSLKNPHRRNAPEGFFFKLTTYVILISFLYSFVIHDPLFAITTIIGEQNTAQALNNKLESFVLPYKYGRFMGGSLAQSQISNLKSRLVIYIQDLHCHPEVQKNIYEIIKLFNNRYNVNRILVEGAPSGKVDTSILSSIPNEKVKKKALTTLLDKGLISGAEYYSVVENQDKLYGLEKWDVYEKNLERIQKLIGNKKENVSLADDLISRIDDIKSKYLSRKLKTLEGRLLPSPFAGEGQGEGQNKRYLSLEKLAQKSNESTSDYPNLSQYIKMLNLNKEIKFKRLPTELSEYTTELKKVLPYTIYKTLLDKLSKSENQEDYYLGLSEIAKEYTPQFSYRYPNAGKFLEYVHLNYTINPINLVAEENALTERMLSRSAETLLDREILTLSRMSRIAKNFVDLKVTTEEYEYFKQNVPRYRLLLQKYIPCEEIKSTIALLGDKDLYDYYETNLTRNDIFLSNIIPVSSKRGLSFPNAKVGNPVVDSRASTTGYRHVLNEINNFQNIEIVVTGGFHTEIVKTLKDKNISYLAITPNVTQDFNDTIYEKVLTLKITPNDVIKLSSVILSKAKDLAFAPWIKATLLTYYQKQNPLQAKELAEKRSEEIMQILAATVSSANKEDKITFADAWQSAKGWVKYLGTIPELKELSEKIEFDEVNKKIKNGTDIWHFKEEFNKAVQKYDISVENLNENGMKASILKDKAGQSKIRAWFVKNPHIWEAVFSVPALAALIFGASAWIIPAILLSNAVFAIVHPDRTIKERTWLFGIGAGLTLITLLPVSLTGGGIAPLLAVKVMLGATGLSLNAYTHKYHNKKVKTIEETINRFKEQFNSTFKVNLLIPFAPARASILPNVESKDLTPLVQVYDIEVEGTHNFIGNGIFAHNTYNQPDKVNTNANFVTLSRKLAIVLINPRSPHQKIEYERQPVGLMSIASVLNDESFLRKYFMRSGKQKFVFNENEYPKHEIDIIDLQDLSADFDLEKFLKEKQPDIVGISAMTPLIGEAKLIASKVSKICPAALKVVGGVHVSALPGETIIGSDFDIGVIGEGEEPFAELAMTVAGGMNDFSSIPGILINKKEGAPQITERNKGDVMKADEYPLPATALGLIYRDNNEQGIIGVIFTSRGCSNACIFCAAQAVFGRGIHLKRSAGHIFKEIKYLHEHGKRTIHIEDDVFTFNKKRIIELSKLIKESGMRIRFTIMTRADFVDEEIAGALKLMGCEAVGIGVESGDQYILNNVIDKRTNLEDVSRATRILKNAGVKVNYFMMVGLPDQNWESIKKSVEFVLKEEPNLMAVSIAAPYPGSRLYNDLRIKPADEYSDYEHFVGIWNGGKKFIAATQTNVMNSSEITRAREILNDILKYRKDSNKLKEYMEELDRNIQGTKNTKDKGAALNVLTNENDVQNIKPSQAVWTAVAAWVPYFGMIAYGAFTGQAISSEVLSFASIPGWPGSFGFGIVSIFGLANWVAKTFFGEWHKKALGDRAGPVRANQIKIGAAFKLVPADVSFLHVSDSINGTIETNPFLYKLIAKFPILKSLLYITGSMAHEGMHFLFPEIKGFRGELIAYIAGQLLPAFLGTLIGFALIGTAVPALAIAAAIASTLIIAGTLSLLISSLASAKVNKSKAFPKLSKKNIKSKQPKFAGSHVSSLLNKSSAIVLLSAFSIVLGLAIYLLRGNNEVTSSESSRSASHLEPKSGKAELSLAEKEEKLLDFTKDMIGGEQEVKRLRQIIEVVGKNGNDDALDLKLDNNGLKPLTTLMDPLLKIIDLLVPDNKILKTFFSNVNDSCALQGYGISLMLQSISLPANVKPINIITPGHTSIGLMTDRYIVAIDYALHKVFVFDLRKMTKDNMSKVERYTSGEAPYNRYDELLIYPIESAISNFVGEQGYVYAKANDPYNAIKYIQDAIDENMRIGHPEANVLHYLNLAFVLRSLPGRDSKLKALEAVIKAKEIIPNHYQVNNIIGLTYRELARTDPKQLNLAIEYFRKTMEIAPNYVPAYFSLSEIYVKLKDFKKTRDILFKTIKVIPNEHISYYMIAQAYIAEKNFPKALDLLRQSLSKCKDNRIRAEIESEIMRLERYSRVGSGKLINSLTKAVLFIYIFLGLENLSLAAQPDAVIPSFSIIDHIISSIISLTTTGSVVTIAIAGAVVIPLLFFRSQISQTLKNNPATKRILQFISPKTNIIKNIANRVEQAFKITMPETRILEGIVGIFGIDEANDEKRHDISREILNVIANSPEDERNNYLDEIVSLMKDVTWFASGEHRFMPLALAVHNMFKGKDIFDPSGIDELGENDKKLFEYMTKVNLLYADPFGIGEEWMPAQSMSLTIKGFNPNKKVYKWLDIGSAPKTNGAPTLNLIKRNFDKAGINMEVYGTDNFFPRYKYGKGKIYDSDYHSKFNNKGELKYNNVTYLDANVAGNNVKAENFMKGHFQSGPFDFISLCMVLHHLKGPGEKNDIVMPLAGDDISFYDNYNNQITPQYQVTKTQQASIRHLIDNLAEGGILFLNLILSKPWIGGKKQANMFLIIQKTENNSCRLYTEAIPFRPDPSPFDSGKHLMDDDTTGVEEITVPGIRTLFPNLDEDFYNAVALWLHRADALIYRKYQKRDESIWRQVRHLQDKIIDRQKNGKITLSWFFEEYLNCADNNDPYKIRILAGVKELERGYYPDSESSKVNKLRPSPIPSPILTISKTVIVKLVAGILLLFVALNYHFIPEINEFINQQYYDQYSIPGTDFWIYSMGSRALFDYGIDPYNNWAMQSLYDQGLLQSGHPNPLIDKDAMGNFIYNKNIPGDYGISGYIASPVNLMIFYLISRFNFFTVFNSYVVFAFASITAVVAFFVRKLNQGESNTNKAADFLILWSALVGMSYPLRASLLHFGQIDLLYFLPVATGLYLYAFHSDSKKSILAASAAIAVAAGIKVFPAIIGAYFVFKLLLDVKDKLRHFNFKSAFSNSYAVMTAGMLLSAVVVFLATVSVVSWDIVHSWITHKAPTLDNWIQTLVAMKPNPRLFPFLRAYLEYAALWTDTNINLYKLYPVLAAFFSVLTLERIRSRSTKNFLPEISLVIALLPIVFPYWYSLYNTIMIIPFITVFFYSRQIQNKTMRILIKSLTFTSFILMNSGMVFVIENIFPHLGPNMWQYFYDPIEPSVLNVLVGFPGNLLLFISSWLLLFNLKTPGNAVGESGSIKAVKKAINAVKSTVKPHDVSNKLVEAKAAFSRAMEIDPQLRPDKIVKQSIDAAADSINPKDPAFNAAISIGAGNKDEVYSTAKRIALAVSEDAGTVESIVREQAGLGMRVIGVAPRLKNTEVDGAFVNDGDSITLPVTVTDLEGKEIGIVVELSYKLIDTAGKQGMVVYYTVVDQAGRNSPEIQNAIEKLEARQIAAGVAKAIINEKNDKNTETQRNFLEYTFKEFNMDGRVWMVESDAETNNIAGPMIGNMERRKNRNIVCRAWDKFAGNPKEYLRQAKEEYKDNVTGYRELVKEQRKERLTGEQTEPVTIFKTILSLGTFKDLVRRAKQLAKDGLVKRIVAGLNIQFRDQDIDGTITPYIDPLEIDYISVIKAVLDNNKLKNSLGAKADILQNAIPKIEEFLKEDVKIKAKRDEFLNTVIRGVVKALDSIYGRQVVDELSQQEKEMVESHAGKVISISRPERTGGPATSFSSFPGLTGESRVVDGKSLDTPVKPEYDLHPKSGVQNDTLAGFEKREIIFMQALAIKQLKEAVNSFSEDNQKFIAGYGSLKSMDDATMDIVISNIVTLLGITHGIQINIAQMENGNAKVFLEKLRAGVRQATINGPIARKNKKNRQEGREEQAPIIMIEGKSDMSELIRSNGFEAWAEPQIEADNINDKDINDKNRELALAGTYSVIDTSLFGNKALDVVKATLKSGIGKAGLKFGKVNDKGDITLVGNMDADDGYGLLKIFNMISDWVPLSRAITDEGLFLEGQSSGRDIDVTNVMLQSLFSAVSVTINNEELKGSAAWTIIEISKRAVLSDEKDNPQIYIDAIRKVINKAGLQSEIGQRFENIFIEIMAQKDVKERKVFFAKPAGLVSGMLGSAFGALMKRNGIASLKERGKELTALINYFEGLSRYVVYEDGKYKAEDKLSAMLVEAAAETGDNKLWANVKYKFMEHRNKYGDVLSPDKEGRVNLNIFDGMKSDAMAKKPAKPKDITLAISIILGDLIFDRLKDINEVRKLINNGSMQAVRSLIAAG